MASYLIKGILSFPTLFTPKRIKQNGVETGEPKFSLQLLLHKDDPELHRLWGDMQGLIQNAWPSGVVPRQANFCLQSYAEKNAHKEHYRPDLADYYELSMTAKETERPAVVYESTRQEVINPGDVYSGQVAYVHFNMDAYERGNGGVGAWLNGVMVTEETSAVGRLDGRPSVDAMFASVTASAPQMHSPGAPATGAPATGAPGAPGAAPAMGAPAAAPAMGAPGAPGAAPAAAPGAPGAPGAAPAAAPVEEKFVYQGAVYTREQLAASKWSDEQINALPRA